MSPRVIVRFLIVAAVISTLFATVSTRSVRAAISATNTNPPRTNSSDPWITSSLLVGYTGPGTLTIDGGSDVNNSNDGTVAYSGNSSTSIVTVTGAGSTWTNTASLYVGYGATGSLDITDGGSVLNTTGYVGRNQRTGTVNVGGGSGTSAWTNSANLYVGNGGTGTLNVTGGGSVSNAASYITTTSGTATVNVGGGTGTATWTSSHIRVGENSGTGRVNVTGGGSVISPNTTIGFNFGNGTVVVGGGMGASTLDGTPMQSQLCVGCSGTGRLDIIGGGSVSSNHASISAEGFGGNGTVNVGGGIGASAWTTGVLFLGAPGALNNTATLNVTGGGSVTTYEGYIGYGSSNTGTVNVGGGAGNAMWENTNAISVGSGGAGTLNINSGGVVIAPGIGGGNAASSVNFNGGTLQITATDSASNTINLLPGGGTIEVPNAGTTFTVSSAISGTGGLTKTGAGSLSLAGANMFSGDTTVNDGTLLVNGSLISAQNDVAVASGAKLGGNGSIAGWVTNAGTVAPGTSVGTLSMNANYEQTPSGKLHIELGSTGYDRLQVGGNIALAGMLEVVLLGGYLPGDGTEFDILDWGNRSGTFATVQLPALPAGLEWDSSQLYATGTLAVVGLAGDFNVDGAVDAADYVVWRKNSGTPEEFNMWRSNFGRTIGSGSAEKSTDSLANVPEPASVMLIVLGTIALDLRSRRRCSATCKWSIATHVGDGSFYGIHRATQ